MELTKITIEQLETDRTFLTTMLRRHGRVEANVLIQRDTDGTLITLSMLDSEIRESIKQAVTKCFGSDYEVSNVYATCGRQLITFTISTTMSRTL